MKESLASASAATWNQKNLPSGPVTQTPVLTSGVLGRVPAAALALARRRPVVLTLAVAGVLSLVWIVSNHD